MIKLKKLLSEEPIDTHQTIGDFSKGSSFTHKADRALVTNPVAVQKVKDFFKNTTETFDFYFVNTKEARHYTEMGRVKESFIYNELGIKPEQLKGGGIDPNAITVFFTNNKGSERAPLTAWVIAHRLGHVLRREYAWQDYLTRWVNEKLSNIMKAYNVEPKSYRRFDDRFAIRKYDRALRQLCEAIGTFKSARDKNLRDPYEFHYELFAQWLKDGQIRLNQCPDVLPTGHRYGYGNLRFQDLEKKDDAAEQIREMMQDYSHYGDSVLGEAIGNIYVM